MRIYSNISIIFCIWALAILTIFYFGFSTLPHSGLFPNDFLKSLANWDGGHYLGIADGYDKAFQFAFFPLYPILINLVSKITGSFLSAGILISFISSLLAINLLYKLIAIEFNKEIAQKAVLALLFFPMSFYFLTVYTESLFLLLTISTFYFARKRQLPLATLTAALVSATRLAGLGVVLGLISYVYLSGGFNRKNWFVFFAPLGFILYSYYLYQQTGDPFYFIQAEDYWHRQLVIPGSTIFNSLQQLVIPGYIAKNFKAFLDFILTILGIGLVWKVFKKLSFDFAIFSLVSLLLPLFSPTLLAVPRYLLTIFPIFIVLAFYKNQYLIFAYLVFSLLFLAGFAVLFITGKWVS
ncbi:glycosyltransferase family 39 protein [Candidatus Daviesbacteria bacterium]|nr:glycosyltransferase family 39 protein [Candidatus Daviesbacteria bacterium]